MKLFTKLNRFKDLTWWFNGRKLGKEVKFTHLALRRSKLMEDEAANCKYALHTVG